MSGTSEGVSSNIFGSQIANSVPLIRLFNGKSIDHFYTISQEEADTVIDLSGYTEEGIAGFVFSNSPATCIATPGTVPLFRVFNGQIVDHFYTTSVAERDLAVLFLGYVDEGVAACVCPTP